ncbi:hypothetical protein [Saccharopolyspora sp. 6V]|uniref:hypothetical protein n=1 Tax=Saccharopolyspora sp. 6V TaxID=2877239 RepID=UPI001CD3F2AE|nr:hypothetical protein [Saccharopolyspora sp. 6V]MCA1191643.1 hypothetical protein [Saccharopolyspora sp. 6V]
MFVMHLLLTVLTAFLVVDLAFDPPRRGWRVVAKPALAGIAAAFLFADLNGSF